MASNAQESSTCELPCARILYTARANTIFSRLNIFFIVNIYIEIKISKNGDLRWAGQTKYITQGDWMVGRNRTKQKLDDAID